VNLIVKNTKGYYECGDKCCTDWTDRTDIIKDDKVIYSSEGDIHYEELALILNSLGHNTELVTIDTTDEDIEFYGLTIGPFENI
jgi:hypothetical protein